MRNTVKSKRDIDRLFKEGWKKTNPYAVILVVPSPAGIEAGRVAFVAGKKVGGAPSRNRAKRVLREAARAIGAPWAGYDVAFVAREKTGQAPQEEIVGACRKSMDALLPTLVPTSGQAEKGAPEGNG